MKKPIKMSESEKKLLYMVLNAITTEEDLDVDLVIEKSYGGNRDLYLTDMVFFLGLWSDGKLNLQHPLFAYTTINKEVAPHPETFPALIDKYVEENGGVFKTIRFVVPVAVVITILIYDNLVGKVTNLKELAWELTKLATILVFIIVIIMLLNHISGKNVNDLRRLFSLRP